MAPKHHPTPLSGGDRKALAKELRKVRAVTAVLAGRSAEFRAEGEALIRKADSLACESWNEKMWADGGPIDPSPLIDQAINGGFPWLQIECSRCKTHRDVDLAILSHVSTTSSMTWRCDCAVGNVPLPGGIHGPNCCSWPNNRASHRHKLRDPKRSPGDECRAEP